MRSFEANIEKLCSASRRKSIDPYTQIEWPEKLEPGQWFTSPELISLYGTAPWKRMTEEQRAHLSFLEAVNFYSINVHGEKGLIEGLAERLYNTDDELWALCSPYLHHFIDEENKHLVYFAGFCRRYAGKIYRDRKLDFPRKYAPGEEDFLFFARVMMFEEIVDVHNQKMASDERLAPIARRINHSHHLEESRHLAFGRQVAQTLFDHHSPNWSRATLEGVRSYLASYMLAMWREYVNPDVYADAGLEAPYELAEAVIRDERCRAHRREMSASCIRFLREHEMLTAEPEL